MIRIKIDSKQVQKEMNNIVAYSFGFLDGTKAGKKILLQNLGENISEILRQYIDAAARANPAMLHHIYEWYQTGSPNARLFDINYIANASGLSFGASFRQSTSIANGSKVPFYNKAQVMEEGMPVIIKPVLAKTLAFEDNGEQVFTRNPVTVSNPGGQLVQGSFEKIWNEFFKMYLSQAFLRTSGLGNYLENPLPFSQKINAGKRFGKSVGYATGLKWIANAGRGVLQ